jgi:hypothetical protein
VTAAEEAAAAAAAEAAEAAAAAAAAAGAPSPPPAAPSGVGTAGGAQFLNPPFLHSLAITPGGTHVAVALGDGRIALLALRLPAAGGAAASAGEAAESERGGARRPRGGARGGGAAATRRAAAAAPGGGSAPTGNAFELVWWAAPHSAAATCVALVELPWWEEGGEGAEGAEGAEGGAGAEGAEGGAAARPPAPPRSAPLLLSAGNDGLIAGWWLHELLGVAPGEAGSLAGTPPTPATLAAPPPRRLPTCAPPTLSFRLRDGRGPNGIAASPCAPPLSASAGEDNTIAAAARVAAARASGLLAVAGVTRDVRLFTAIRARCS